MWLLALVFLSPTLMAVSVCIHVLRLYSQTPQSTPVFINALMGISVRTLQEIAWFNVPTVLMQTTQPTFACRSVQVTLIIMVIQFKEHVFSLAVMGTLLIPSTIEDAKLHALVLNILKMPPTPAYKVVQQDFLMTPRGNA